MIITVNDTIVVPVAVVAVADTAFTTVGTSVTIPLLANDLGDDIVVTAVTPSSNGSYVVTTDGSIIYTPNTNLTVDATDQFTYTICNPSGECDSTTVTIFITAPTDTVLTAVDDVSSTDLNMAVVISVLDNDIIPADDVAAIFSISNTPQNGFAIINPNGTIIYTPNNNFTGIDTFDYVLCGLSVCDTATVIIAVNDTLVVPNPVVAVADTAFTTVGTSVTVPLLANDLGDDIVTVNTVEWSLVTTDGSIIYTPNTDLSVDATDQFTYTICNPSGECRQRNRHHIYNRTHRHRFNGC
ncbi:MAG: hypothetical protein IPN94_03065 [Sphingobacteriales bacterium]|nr:hypothetical protein [Sphingobacteriales bacterium]